MNRTRPSAKMVAEYTGQVPPQEELESEISEMSPEGGTNVPSRVSRLRVAAYSVASGGVAAPAAQPSEGLNGGMQETSPRRPRDTTKGAGVRVDFRVTAEPGDA